MSSTAADDVDVEATFRALPPAWRDDRSARNAVEVLDGLKRKKFREDKSATLWCENCTAPRRRLVRVFIGLADSGAARSWLLVPAFDLAGRAVPALCAPAPRPGDPPWGPLLALCQRCRRGVLVLYPSREVEAARRSGEEGHFVVRFGAPKDTPFAAGDLCTTARGGDRWAAGPAGSWLVYLDAPTQGQVAE